MNAAVILIIGIVILALGYVFYGGWLSKQWGIDPSRTTPAHELEDGQDYCPAKAPVLMGHHFSSIAGAGPINGPIQAAVFGWVPVLLWVLIGGIFFGGVHDFGALFASVRNDGQSIGTVVESSIGKKAKRLFLIFSYLTLILVVAAFASIVANTFKATYLESGAVDVAKSAANATTAIISLLFIVLAIFFGFFVYRRNAPLGVSTLIGVVVIALIMWLGIKWHPIYLSYQTWMIICGIYILVASVTPVWILLQPRDYLSSFLLYAMMLLALIGVVGAHPSLDMPAFTGFVDTVAPTGSSLGYMFPALFVTIACGAISGFHSLVGSGTTAKQLNNEKDAQPIAYGGMLIECVLALVSLCAVAYIWERYKTGEVVTPTVVFATGLSEMLGKVFGAGAVNVTYTLMVLAVSVFCLTSLDTATRLARYMFQEFWLKPGEKVSDPTVTGARKVLCNPYGSTAITVVLGIALGMTGYAKIWPLFGAANQLLAGLGLLAVAAWLGKMGRNNKMFMFPMIFMILVTLTSLVFTIKAQIVGIIAGLVSGQLTENFVRVLPGSTSVVFWLSCWSSLQSTSSSRAARRSRLTARRLSRPNRRTAQNVTPVWALCFGRAPIFCLRISVPAAHSFIFSCKRRGNMAYCRQYSHGRCSHETQRATRTEHPAGHLCGAVTVHCRRHRRDAHQPHRRGRRPDTDVAVPLFPQQGRACLCRVARCIGDVFLGFHGAVYPRGRVLQDRV